MSQGTQQKQTLSNSDSVNAPWLVCNFKSCLSVRSRLLLSPMLQAVALISELWWPAGRSRCSGPTATETEWRDVEAHTPESLRRALLKGFRTCFNIPNDIGGGIDSQDRLRTSTPEHIAIERSGRLQNLSQRHMRIANLASILWLQIRFLSDSSLYERNLSPFSTTDSPRNSSCGSQIW